MDIVNNSNLSNEQLEVLVKAQDFKFGFFDMYYNGGAIRCFATPEVIVMIMHESNYSDARGGGGIERKSGIFIFNEKLEKIGENWLKEYRNRNDGKYDDYSLELKEILTVENAEDRVIVNCKNGKGGETRVVVLKVKPMKD